MQDAHISPQQICTLKVMFRALCILECACGIEHSCTCKCVHVVSLWKTQRYHGNAEQSIQKERERLGRRCVSRPAPLGDSYTVTLFKDFYSSSFHVLKSLFLFFIAPSTHFLPTSKSHFLWDTHFDNTSNNTHAVHVLNIYLKMLLFYIKYYILYITNYNFQSNRWRAADAD